jgi:hypothetical protein
MSHGPKDTQCNGTGVNVIHEAEVLSESKEALHQEEKMEKLAENRSLELRVVRREVE